VIQTFKNLTLDDTQLQSADEFSHTCFVATFTSFTLWTAKERIVGKLYMFYYLQSRPTNNHGTAPSNPRSRLVLSDATYVHSWRTVR